jgi:DNA primase
MALVSQDVRHRIRAANDIVEVIGAALPLKRAGASWVGLCPFHKEKTPSFHVNPQRQIFHCFGCHKGGDVFRFIQDYENLPFPEALRRLAQRAGIALEFDDDPGRRQARHVKEALLDMHEQITGRWHQVLRNEAGGQPGRDYLARRGVSDDAIREFRLGYAPEAWEDTLNWAKGRTFDVSLLEQAGLVVRRENAPGHYDRFRGRLMFPICDEQGRVIAFSGRVLDADAKTAKYINSPETPLFTKSRVVFGLDKTKRALLDAGHAIICEGQLDLIACYMAGVRNVVAPQGTALTADHLRLLKRYVNELVLCFDSDEAGQNAMIRSLDTLLASGLSIRVATLPPPHDPDSLIRSEGVAALRRAIDAGEPFFDFYLKRLCRTHDPQSDRGRVTVARSMGEALHKAGSAVLMDTYARKTALRLAVSPEAVLAEFRRSGGKRPITAPANAAPVPATAADAAAAAAALPPPTPPSAKERWLLKLLLSDTEAIEWATRHLDPAWLQHAATRRLVTTLFRAFHESASAHDLTAWIGQLDDPELISLATAAMADSQAITKVVHQLSEVVLWIRNQHLDHQRRLLMQRSLDANLSDPERNAMIATQDQLKRQRLQPLEPLHAASAS